MTKVFLVYLRAMPFIEKKKKEEWFNDNVTMFSSSLAYINNMELSNLGLCK